VGLRLSLNGLPKPRRVYKWLVLACLYITGLPARIRDGSTAVKGKLVREKTILCYDAFCSRPNAATAAKMDRRPSELGIPPPTVNVKWSMLRFRLRLANCCTVNCTVWGPCLGKALIWKITGPLYVESPYLRTSPDKMAPKNGQRRFVKSPITQPRIVKFVWYLLLGLGALWIPEALWKSTSGLIQDGKRPLNF